MVDQLGIGQMAHTQRATRRRWTTRSASARSSMSSRPCARSATAAWTTRAGTTRRGVGGHAGGRLESCQVVGRLRPTLVAGRCWPRFGQVWGDDGQRCAAARSPESGPPADSRQHRRQRPGVWTRLGASASCCEDADLAPRLSAGPPRDRQHRHPREYSCPRHRRSSESESRAPILARVR